MQSFLVGGAVRDNLLNIPVKDRDWVVIGATPKLMEEKGFVAVGKDFPVFLHPSSKEEYALARTERKSGVGYKGFTIHADKDVTLEEDLARRDLTINAIAQHEDGKYTDPFNGIDDLNNKILRHVSDAFCEDPVRVLRIARFSARLHHLGFCIAPTTLKLMRKMVASGELDHLVPERVWQEMSGALEGKSPHIFFRVLRQCGALKTLLPELDTLFGVPQDPKHHPEVDTGVHSLLSLTAAARETKNSAVRFASLMHDVGKGMTAEEHWPRHPEHEKTGALAISTLCMRLKIPNEHRELAMLASRFHTNIHKGASLDATQVLALLNKTDAFRRTKRFKDLLTCAKADSKGRTFMEKIDYPQEPLLNSYLNAAKTVTAKDVLTENPALRGMEIGKAIEKKQLIEINKLLEVPT